MKNNFSKLFKSFRERQNLSKSELARKIKKSDAYIRKIENGGYTPPTYELCITLSDIFNHNATEKQQFLESAFIERSQSNASFLPYFKSQASNVVCLPNKTSFHLCSYHFQIQTNKLEPIITKDISIEIERIILECIEEFTYYLRYLSIDTNNITLIVNMPSNTNPLEFISGLASLTAQKIKNNFTKLQQTPNIWSKEFHINTVYSEDTIETIISKINSKALTTQHTS